MTEGQRHGKIMLVVAIATIPIWFLLSKDYVERFGFMTSFFKFMNIYRGSWFCGDPPQAEDCWQVVIMTKYLIAGSAVVATYGYLIAHQLASSPVLYMRKLSSAKESPDA